MGYSQSKWVAEKLVWQAKSRGLPVTIFRPGIVRGYSQTGIADLSDYRSRLIKGCIQIGSIPVLENNMDQSVPVDYLSRAIVHISRHKKSFGKAFNLANPQNTYFNEFNNFFWL